MKKFRHVKTGITVKDGLDSYCAINGDFLIPKYIVENSKDWEEVPEKPEWTILSLISNKRQVHKVVNNVTYTYSDAPMDKKAWVGGVTPLNLIENHRCIWEIYSVLRVSDSEVFTIKDLINDNEEILSISFDKGHWGNDSEIAGEPMYFEENLWLTTKAGSTSIKFCKKVKPKEWEITGFISKKGNTFTLDKNNKKFTKGGYFGQTGYMDLEQALNDKLIKIYSVKRLSDGMEFKIGDKTNFGNLTGFKLDKHVGLEIQHNPSGEDLDDSCWGIGLLQKAKEKLFTTLDVVDIYQGDNYFKLNTSSWQGWIEIANRKPDWSCGFKVFSTTEKAEEYILLNKPYLSINDVLNLRFPENLNINNLKTVLKELVKQK